MNGSIIRAIGALYLFGFVATAALLVHLAMTTKEELTYGNSKGNRVSWALLNLLRALGWPVLWFNAGLMAGSTFDYKKSNSTWGKIRYYFLDLTSKAFAGFEKENAVFSTEYPYGADRV